MDPLIGAALVSTAGQFVGGAIEGFGAAKGNKAALKAQQDENARNRKLALDQQIMALAERLGLNDQQIREMRHRAGINSRVFSDAVAQAMSVGAVPRAAAALPGRGGATNTGQVLSLADKIRGGVPNAR